MSERDKDNRDVPQEAQDFNEWFLGLSGEKVLGREIKMTPELARTALEFYGAEFNPEIEGYPALSEYSNLERRPGMDAVWGRNRVSAFNTWTNWWAEHYEAAGGTLPKLDKSGKNTSGMRQIFGETTSFAAGLVTEDEFVERTRIRINNGIAYAEGRLGDREEIETSQSKKARLEAAARGEKTEPRMFRPSSVPPGFIKEWLNWLPTSAEEE